ncbi:hypothetical protein [Vibrio cholerae]|uniref:hypothetical protein n=1 Tax=Vibrio cholerae TaxID=666 RepID=UPI00048E5392|nr:hypothetical protein [Vibrio cholerae]EGQ9731000.1 hypothetical protein [Vibrio cholerae]EGR1420490.1 hypothetical protein [Vibrio cholerae]PNM49123.1 hypothetical protein AL535_005980 [Vibrio cholerae]TQO88482.1 hypothetical protein FLM10_01825 [Vibrio cholerae]TQP39195.1 hypothetical protein FLM01_09180 [Vibrio cholerae]
MMKSIIKSIFLIGMYLNPLAVIASDNMVAKVTYTGLYGNGRLFIAVDKQINEPGCQNYRIDVAPNHPQIDRWLSIALAAYTTGGEIQFKTNGCYGIYPTLDLTDQTWLHTKPR